MKDSVLIYLSRTFRISHMVAIGLGLVLVSNAFANPGLILSFVLLILPIALLITRKEYLEIDTKGSRYRTVIRFLGVEFPRSYQSYSQIEGIQMKSSKMSKTMVSRASQSTVSYWEFDAYLLMEFAEPYYLFTESTEEKLVARLEPILMDLQVPLYN